MSTKTKSASLQAQPTEPKQVKKQTVPVLALFLLALVPALVYFNVVNQYSVNFPYQDDYDGVLDFLNKFVKADLAQKAGLLFSQHGEHRIFSSRLLYVIDHGLFGKVNFPRLIFAGNVQLVVFFLIVLFYTRHVVGKFWLVPGILAGFCIFDLSSYENADFALSGTVNYGLLMLFAGSMYLYDSDKPARVGVAALVHAICIFSSGAGVLTGLIVVLHNLIKGKKTALFTSIGVVLLFAPLYFLNYVKTTPQGFVEKKFDLVYISTFFMRLAGSHFGYEQAVAFGVILCGVAVAVLPVDLKNPIQSWVKKDHAFFIALLVFIFATITMLSVFRSNSVMGEKAAYQSRYLIYSHLLLAILIILGAQKTALLPKTNFWVAMGVAGMVVTYAYQKNYEYGEACLNMTKNRLIRYPYYYGSHTEEDNKKAQAIEQESCRLGIYCISDER